jgi:hypothetical protein
LAIPRIPWGSVISIFPYSNWRDLLSAILALVVSSGYTLNQLRVWRHGRNDSEGRTMGLKIATALVYGVGLFVVTNWDSIWSWLFKLRYGN